MNKPLDEVRAEEARRMKHEGRAPVLRKSRWLLAAGMPLPAVSERLGHSSDRATADVYSHAIRGQDAEAARRREEVPGAAWDKQ